MRMVNDLLDPTEASSSPTVRLRRRDPLGGRRRLEEEDADTGTQVLRPPSSPSWVTSTTQTSLLDAIRKSKVAEKEFGGIPSTSAPIKS